MGSAGRRIAVTGASGYVGFRLVERLAEDDGVELVLATDVRPPGGEPHPGLPQQTGEGVKKYGEAGEGERGYGQTGGGVSDVRPAGGEPHPGLPQQTGEGERGCGQTGGGVSDVRPAGEPHPGLPQQTGEGVRGHCQTGEGVKKYGEAGEGVRGGGAKVVYRRYDVTEPAGTLFADYEIDSVVHLAYVLEPRRDRDAVRKVNVGGAANVLDACDGAGVSYLLYLSSTSVYGAHADNPAELTEDSPPRPVKGFQYSEEKLESEKLFDEYGREHPDCGIAILRGCPVLGPDADNYIARSFLSPVFVGFMGEDPPMQFMHEDDLVEIMARCVLERVTGLYNAAGRGSVRWSRMAQSLGRPRVCLPAPLLTWVTRASWTIGLQSQSPAPGLDYARYRWVASPEKLRNRLGYTRERSSEETWEEFARERGSAGRGPAPSRETFA